MKRFILLLLLALLGAGCVHVNSGTKKTDAKDVRLQCGLWIRSHDVWDFNVYVADQTVYVARRTMHGDEPCKVVEMDDVEAFMKFARSVEALPECRPPFPPPGPYFTVVRLTEDGQEVEKISCCPNGGQSEEQMQFISEMNGLFERSRKSRFSEEQISRGIPADWYKNW